MGQESSDLGDWPVVRSSIFSPGQTVFQLFVKSFPTGANQSNWGLLSEVTDEEADASSDTVEAVLMDSE